MSRRFLLVSLCLCGVLFVAIRCSKATTTSDDITDSNSAISSIPVADPSTMDYAISGASSSTLDSDLQARANELRSEGRPPSGGGFGEATYLRITRGTGLQFTINQCVGSTHMGYATYTVTGKKFTGDTYFRYQGNSVDIGLTKVVGKSITDADFVGNIDLKFNSEARLILAADGSTDTNTLKGSKGSASIACKWNSTLGCGKLENGSAVSFAVSANATTGKKTYSDSSDTTMCSGLEFTTVTANATLTSSQTWDCLAPSGKSFTKVSLSNSAVEDAGGSSCKTASDFWESADKDPSSCGSGTAASSVGCFCDALYAIAVQNSRMAYRMLECKAKGIFKLIKDGTITGITLNEGETAYIQLESTGF